MKNGKFHANFTLLGRSADLWRGDFSDNRSLGFSDLSEKRIIESAFQKVLIILSKSEADTGFQYRPRIVDTDTIADAIFADAISETST